MTDNDIIKALGELELYDGFQPKIKILIHNAIYLIGRQKEEIERLKHRKTELQIRNQELQHEKSEAIKEFSNELIKTLKYALYGLDIKEKTISKEEVQKRFELLMHKDIPEVIEYVKNKMVGDEK